MACPTTRHWCTNHGGGQTDSAVYCNEPHPDLPDVRCRRFLGHSGEQHAAYSHRISEAAVWTGNQSPPPF